MIYFGFTIGPVVRTILQARKTRELWASSFIFSFFMKNLLLELRGFGDVFAPDILGIENGEKQHGAGIWPDRCFLEIQNATGAEKLKKALPSLIEKALEKVNVKLGGSQLADLKKYFHYYVCCFDSANDNFNPINGTEKKFKETHLFRLNKMLDDLELMPKFQARDEYNLLEKLDDEISVWYKEGYGDEDEVLRQWQHGKKPQMRVWSLPEIALQEFAKTGIYYNEVVLKIEESIVNYRENKRKKEEVKNKGREENIAEEAIYKTLKTKLKEDLRSRHRYIAIVHADGDGIGQTIASLKNDTTEIKRFSTELMKFSKKAVEEIHKFGAMPVYAGGDDLLFIAPLQNDEKKTIFGLLKSLRDDFSNREIFEKNGATLSFGLSISYYKYPLAEALETSLHQLKDKAKNNCIGDKNKKDALAVRLLTHSGHQFEAVLWQKGSSFQKWLDLFEPSEKLEEAFIAGLMHKTDLLALWLWDACDRGTLEHFFKKHFNEAAHSEKGKFVENVQALALAIFDDYQFKDSKDDLTDKEDPYREKRRLGQKLHAMLRLVQFQNAPDHD